MRPRAVTREFLEEHCCGNRSGRTPRTVQHVGDLALQLLAILVEERQLPHLFAGSLGRVVDVIDPRLRRAPQAGCDLAKRDHDGTGERRDVDQVRRAKLPRVPKTVAEDQGPSASVLFTSTVRPLAPLRMSPGFVAFPP